MSRVMRRWFDAMKGGLEWYGRNVWDPIKTSPITWLVVGALIIWSI